MRMLSIMAKIWRTTLIKYWSIAGKIYLKAKGVKIGNNVKIYGFPIISRAEGSTIELEDNVTLCSDSRFTDLGVNHPVVIRTLTKNARIVIKKDTGISGGSICSASEVTIGNECLIGANTTISDTDFHALIPKNRRYNKNNHDIQSSPILIGDNVFIGTNSTVLKGIIIGNNSVIGAGSIVTKTIESDCVAAGTPAKLIKKIHNEN